MDAKMRESKIFDNFVLKQGYEEQGKVTQICVAFFLEK
jgi:hypothetical protein